MVKKGDIITLPLDGMDKACNGTGEFDSNTIHVKTGTPGDIVTVKIAHISPHRPEGWADIVKVDSPGPNRQKHFCNNSILADGGCGGCATGHLKPSARDTVKTSFIKESLQKYSLAISPVWNPSTNQTGYRNRTNLVPFVSQGAVHLGSFAPETRRPVRMDGCPILENHLTEAVTRVEAILNRLNPPVYPASDSLRYVTMRTCGNTVLVDLVCSSGEPGWLQECIDALESIEGIAGVTATVNDLQGNAIRPAQSRELSRSITGFVQAGPLRLEMASTTFFQLNTEVASSMYSHAARWAENAAVIVDLYCGIGGLGLTVAKHTGGQLFGAEFTAQSVELARKNALSNGIEARFEAANLEKQVPQSCPREGLLLLNPPRKGLSTRVLEFVAESDFSSVIYMSCNPDSFARDAQKLQALYSLTKLEGFDMLPATPHVEILGLFEKEPK